ncbi:hypothetical protein OAN21_00670 [Alphaproteobacteria bacterium]|nr:hypothetical protein [Alphaproteobacteria bacterium]
MKKLLSLIVCLFLSASSIFASMEDWDGSTERVTQLKQSEDNSFLENQPEGEDLPEGFSPPALKALTPAQKLGCCFVSCLPCLCVIGCFNRITSWINQGTCGLLYQGCPCLDCAD